MTMHVRDAGIWKTVEDPQVRDAGVWKPVQEGYVRDAGVWKKFYERLLIQLAGGSIGSVTLGSQAIAILDVKNDGTEVKTNHLGVIGTSDWMVPPTPALASNYEVRTTATGDTPTGTLGTWLSLGTTRSWSLGLSSAGSKSCVLSVSIRDAATLNVLATASYDLSVEYSNL